MSFADSIKKNTEKIKSEINESVNTMAKELFELVIDRTPVETGRLRSNWYVGLNSISYDSNESLADPSGNPSYARLSVLDNSKVFLSKDGLISLSTSVVGWNAHIKDYSFYAYWIENFGWSKNKAPTGMVKISLLDIANKYKII